MNSIDPICNELKWKYDECFNRWLSEEYINTEKKFPENYVPCEQFQAPYKACVSQFLEREGIQISETIDSVKAVCAEDLKTAKIKIEDDNQKDNPPQK